jgi:archaellum component FlaC
MYLNGINEDSNSDVSKLRKEIEKELTETFEKTLKDAIVGLKEEVSEQIKEEYSSDPEVGGAKGVLAAIAEMVSVYKQDTSEEAVRDALRASELAVSEAVAQRDVAISSAKKAEHTLRVEKAINGHPMAESIRKIFEGREFESLEKLDETISSVLADMPGPGTVVPVGEVKLIEENAKLLGKITLLEGKVEELQDKVARAVALGERIEKQRISAIEEANIEIDKLNEELERVTIELDGEKSNAMEIKESAEAMVRNAEAKVYKLEKVVPFANGRKMLELMESVNDPKVVDKLVESLGVEKMQDPMLESMRKHQKGLVSKDKLIIEDSIGKGNSACVTDDLGNSMDEMARMAGIPARQN